MSVSFSIIPVDENFQTEDAKKWLQEMDITLPIDCEIGHSPSFKEIDDTLKNIRNLRADYKVSSTTWHVNVWKNNLYLEFDSPFSGNMADEYATGVRGSIDLMIEIMSELVEVCGTLLMLINGEDAILFLPRTHDNA